MDQVDFQNVVPKNSYIKIPQAHIAESSRNVAAPLANEVCEWNNSLERALWNIAAIRLSQRFKNGATKWNTDPRMTGVNKAHGNDRNEPRFLDRGGGA